MQLKKQYKKNATEQEIKEFDDDIGDLFLSDNWQNEVVQKVDKWRKKNPIFVFIILYLVIPMLVAVMYDYIKSVILNDNARIKDSPSNKGETIIIVPANAEVTIINNGNIPYYYKVVYYDPNTELEYEGYINKKYINRASNSETKVATNTNSL